MLRQTFQIRLSTKTIVISATFIAFCLPHALCLAAEYKCTRVTDGDTTTVVSDGQKLTIRLAGIDAPEKSRGKHKQGQPFSQKSTKHLAGLILNKYVDIVSYGTDRYGRTLGVVYAEGQNMNLEMVKAGLWQRCIEANRQKGLTMDPMSTEGEARKTDRGIWSLGDQYISPREWRRMSR